ncbi:MAG: phage holin family protein [Saprospiraceae bacterium]
MKERDSLLEKSGEIYTYAREYLNLKLEYFKLEMGEKTGKVASSLITMGILSVVFIFILLMFSLATGFYLGEQMDSYPLAFLILTGFYLVAGLILFVFREKWITTPLVKMIINELFD